MCEPKLISKSDPRYIVCPGQQIPAHYYRLKAVDDVKILGNMKGLFEWELILIQILYFFH